MDRLASIERVTKDVESLASEMAAASAVLDDLRLLRARLQALQQSAETDRRALSEALESFAAEWQEISEQWEALRDRAQATLDEGEQRHEELEAALATAAAAYESRRHELGRWRDDAERRLEEAAEHRAAETADQLRRQLASFREDQFRRIEDIEQAYRLLNDRLREHGAGMEARLARLEADRQEDMDVRRRADARLGHIEEQLRRARTRLQVLTLILMAVGTLGACGLGLLLSGGI